MTIPSAVCREDWQALPGLSGSQDTEHTDTVTELLGLLWGHRTVSTPDTG